MKLRNVHFASKMTIIGDNMPKIRVDKQIFISFQSVLRIRNYNMTSKIIKFAI